MSHKVIKRGRDTKLRTRYFCKVCETTYTAETWERAATRTIRLALAIQEFASGASISSVSVKYRVAVRCILRGLTPLGTGDVD